MGNPHAYHLSSERQEQVRRQRLNGGWCAMMSLASFSMLKIQSGLQRDLQDNPMGGLKVRTKKLHAITIWALVIDKSLCSQCQKSKNKQLVVVSNNCNIPCCGEVLRTLSTNVCGDSHNWHGKNHGMVIRKGIG